MKLENQAIYNMSDDENRQANFVSNYNKCSIYNLEKIF